MITKTDKQKKEKFIQDLIKKGKSRAYSEKQYQRMLKRKKLNKKRR
jgi:hypothetical protein